MSGSSPMAQGTAAAHLGLRHPEAEVTGGMQILNPATLIVRVVILTLRLIVSSKVFHIFSCSNRVYGNRLSFLHVLASLPDLVVSVYADLFLDSIIYSTVLFFINKIKSSANTTVSRMP